MIYVLQPDSDCLLLRKPLTLMDFPAIESACGHRSGHVQAWALSILLYSSVGADPLMIFILCFLYVQ